MIQLDLSKRLEITIKNEKPVVLTDLTLSLLAVSEQFQKFVETGTNQDYQAEAELYIRDVRSGSIIVELVVQAMPIIPLIWHGGSLSEWVNTAKATVEWLLGKKESAPSQLTKTDLKQWHSIVEPVAKDSASQLNFSVTDQGTVINHFFISSQDANAAQNSIKRRLQAFERPNDHVHSRKVMCWYQTKFDTTSHTGDKAIIEDISKRPVKVIFENNAVKDAMVNGDGRFQKPWQKLAYIVDVEVQTIAGEPKLYTVLRYHSEHTFDPDE